jgi:hypothetical protein
LLSLLAAAIAEPIRLVNSDESKEGVATAVEGQFPGMGMMPGMGGMMPGMGGMMPGMGGMMPGMGGMPSPANGNCGCQQICQPW